MQAIGIDIGTTSICGVIIDVTNGEVLKSVTKNSDSFLKSDKAFEKIQSVDKIISTANEILNSFICDETAVIGVTGQMHGIVYTDKDGKAVSPLYTWQDGRGNKPYKNTTYAEFLKSNTGYGNVTDFYNRENGLVPKTAENYCTIHDYFVMQLCGLKKAIIHTSDAASFGCYDLKTNSFTYDCDLNITADYTIAGTYKNIPVSVAIGDNQASVFSCLADPNKILLNIGTGSQVSIISDKIIQTKNVETRPYFENKYLIVGSALCGGRAYSVLKDFFLKVFSYTSDFDEGSVYKIMDKMVENIVDSNLIVDTRFSGTRADTSIKGKIENISTENFTPENLAYGVLSGMLNELYQMYLEMQVEKSGIIGSGNGIRKNKPLVKIAEDLFDSQLLIPYHAEEAAYGAALFALIGAGVFKDANQAQKLIKFI